MQLATKGIQYSDVPQSRIRYAPTDRHRPAEKIKLTANDAPSTSVIRLPSKYPNTIPHTMPNGKPLKKRNIKLYGFGVMAKNNHDNVAMLTIRRIPFIRACAPSSETTFIPMNLESM